MRILAGLIKGDNSVLPPNGYLELEGVPDMVLEVVSRSSVRKDTVLMRQAYWRAATPTRTPMPRSSSSRTTAASCMAS